MRLLPGTGTAMGRRWVDHSGQSGANRCVGACSPPRSTEGASSPPLSEIQLVDSVSVGVSGRDGDAGGVCCVGVDAPEHGGACSGSRAW